MTRRRNPPETPAAPTTLSAEAKKLWRDIMDEYVLDDAASTALLRQLCEALDRVRQCQAAIRKDGMTVEGANGQPRPHPLLTIESENRRAMLACCRALRLNNVEA